MKHKRTYPFTESVPMTSTTSSNTSNVTLTNLRVTTYKTNPFHGIDRVLFAVDEWGHRHLHGRTHHIVMGGFCNWWDRRLMAEQSDEPGEVDRG